MNFVTINNHRLCEPSPLDIELAAKRTEPHKEATKERLQRYKGYMGIGKEKEQRNG